MRSMCTGTPVGNFALGKNLLFMFFEQFVAQTRRCYPTSMK